MTLDDTYRVDTPETVRCAACDGLIEAGDPAVVYMNGSYADRGKVYHSKKKCMDRIRQT